jgi:hypothetical protein
MAVRHTFIASQDGLHKYHNLGLPEEECFKTADLTPTKAIRAKCLECSNYSFREVKKCDISYCPLYPFRLGKAHRSKHAVEAQKTAPRGGAFESKIKTNREV